MTADKLTDDFQFCRDILRSLAIKAEDICGHTVKVSHCLTTMQESKGSSLQTQSQSYRLRMGVHVSGGLASEMDQSQ